MNKTNGCQHCTKPLSGRSDKKFCDDGCRSNHHNDKRRLLLGKRSEILRQLEKNHRCLVDAISWNTQIHISDLLRMGFNQKFHTHTEILGATKPVKMLFDKGYFVDELGFLTIFDPEKPEYFKKVAKF